MAPTARLTVAGEIATELSVLPGFAEDLVDPHPTLKRPSATSRKRSKIEDLELYAGHGR